MKQHKKAPKEVNAENKALNIYENEKGKDDKETPILGRHFLLAFRIYIGRSKSIGNNSMKYSQFKI